MPGQVIDLTQIDFLLICVASVLALAPLRHSGARRVIWALLNVSFIVLILRWNAAGILAAIPVLFILHKGIAGAWRLPATLLVAALIGVLFVLHKLPFLADRIGADPLTGMLSMIGFSYVALRMIDLERAVFEGRHPPPDIVSLVNYLLPFHMLAAGPIQAYDEFVRQPAVPAPLTRRDVLIAAERITTGLFKKFVLAYAIQKTFLTEFEADGLYFFLEVQLFFLWLYLDFSAYSDLAVGIGRLMGVATPENFDRPYAARNAIDFWNRWHISLSRFIRRNIFIPLQLNLTRKWHGHHPLWSASIAFTIAFVLCGLWHGLNVNFFLWGAIHALGLVVANLWREFLKKKLGSDGMKKYLSNRKIKLLAQFITYEFVAFSLVVIFIP